MKTKFKLSKRIFSLVLALVMVVSMMPIEAEAAKGNLDYGFSFVMWEENGRKISYNTTYGSAEIKEGSAAGTWILTLYNVKSDFVDVTLDKVEYTFEDVNCASAYNTERFMDQWTLYDEWVWYHLSDNYSLHVNLKRAQGHLVSSWTSNHNGLNHKGICSTCNETVNENCSGGNATCVAKAVCSTCGGEYGSLSSTHTWGDWTYSEDGKHIRTCTLDTTHTESGNCDHKAATCQVASACSVCKHEYAKKLDHSYTYTADSFVLTEKCTNGCGHQAIADIVAGEAIYTGSAITNTATISYTAGTWAGDEPVLSFENNVNVGTATAKMTAGDATASTTFKINPASLDNANIALEYTSISYDGKNQKPAYTVTLDGFGTLQEGRDYKAVYCEVMKMENGVPAKWFGDGQTDCGECIAVGDYSVIIRGGDSGNFTTSGPFSAFAHFAIIHAQPTADMFQVVLPKDAVYTGNDSYSATVTCNTEGLGAFVVKYNGETTAPSAAGTYTVTVDVEESKNYAAVTGLKLGQFTVAKIDGSASVSIEGWTYGDEAKKPVPVSSTNDTDNVTYQYKVKGADDSTYTSTVPADAGYYTVKAAFGATQNYNAVTATADFEIKQADPGIGAVTAGVVNDTLETSAIVLTRENTAVEGILTVDAGQTLALGENTIRYTFTPADGTNYKVVKGEVAVTVVDTIAPTGTVTVSANNWAEFLNSITFGLFFKETQTVSVSASDNLSGVAKIEYIESATAMDLDAVKAAQQWMEMKNGSVSVTLEDAKQFIHYIRITDKSGNVTYLSTDGAEYDTTAPVIEGVNNGATYYTTQTVTVTDKNIDTITLNGEAATGSITLEGNKEAAYTIVATDKAGNSTTVTVTMKPIKELAKVTENLGNDNVTSADAPALNELVDKLDELIADPDTSDDGEKETLEQHKVIAESLLKTIDEAAKATETENTEKVEDVTAENVTPEDKTDLEKAKDDLEKALEDKVDNYTEDEKKAIEDEIKRIDDALAVIGNVEAVEALIDELPDTIKKDDAAAIKASDDAYNALSDYEKSLVDEDAKKALTDAKAALAALNKPADPNSPATGDNSHLMLWIALFFISSGAVVTLTTIEKKRKTAK